MLQHLKQKHDTKKTMSETPQKDEIPQVTARTVPLTIHAQYIKDFSFENPHAPQSLLPGQAIPAMDVSVTLDAKKVPDEKNQNTVYEIILHIEAKATRGTQVVFLTHLDYATVASVNKEVPERHHHPLLMVEVPKLAFPFARQVLADVTSQAGYPPLLLNPVDFEGMYRDQFLAQAKTANKQAV